MGRKKGKVPPGGPGGGSSSQQAAVTQAGEPQGQQQPQQQQQQQPPQQPHGPDQQSRGPWGAGGPQGQQKSQQQPQQPRGPQKQSRGPWGAGGPQGQQKSQQQPQQPRGPHQQSRGSWGAGGPQGQQKSQQQPQQPRGPQKQSRGPWGAGGPQGQQQPQQQQQQQQPQQPHGPDQQSRGSWGAGGPQGQQKSQQQPQQPRGPHQQSRGPWGAGGPQGQQQPQQQQQQQPPQPGPDQQGAQSMGGNERQKPLSKKSVQQTTLVCCPRIREPNKQGRKIKVDTNYFRLTIANLNITLHHYHVTLEPAKLKSLRRIVWNKFASSMFPGRVTVFDGMSNVYSKGPLVTGKSLQGSVSVFNDQTFRETEFSVVVEEVKVMQFSAYKNLKEKLTQDNKLKALPEYELMVLETIMRNWALDNFKNSGRSFFVKKQNNARTSRLSDKLEMRLGYFQSVCLGDHLYLNYDLSHKAFYRDCALLDIVRCFMDRSQRVKMQEFSHFLRGAKVEYQLPNNPQSRRIFSALELVGTATQQTFKTEEGKKLTVMDYFETEKKCKLRHPELPLLWVGSRQKTVYLPLEFCKIVEDQVYRGQMDPFETRQMVKEATSDARRRREELLRNFSNTNYGNPAMKEFGITVSKQMERVDARVLDAPELRTREVVSVRDGVWRIRELLEARSLPKWCLLNLDQMAPKQTLFNFQEQIKRKGMELKMKIGDPTRNPVNGTADFAGLKRAFSQLRDMNIVFVVIPEIKGVYSKVKTICETQEGVLTQCVRGKTLSQDQGKIGTTIQNILLKVNAKLGGKNHCLAQRSFPRCLDGLVMVVGADVTHPSPGSRMPSVAAVAVSCDAEAFEYGSSIRVQTGEIIQDLEGIMEEHLRKFKNARGSFPEKIIIFRDGVSEGQLVYLITDELAAIKRACAKLCQPKITLLVVQKRHHTRFYPTKESDEIGRNYNVPVGTCVDSEIVHPRDLDFYLVSHASILGTARPTRYRLIHDDNKMNDEEVEKLCYYLCHMFPRCTRSVSYPAPTYNAHLAAFRARAYLEGIEVTPNEELQSIQSKIQDKISSKSAMFFV